MNILIKLFLIIFVVVPIFAAIFTVNVFLGFLVVFALLVWQRLRRKKMEEPRPLRQNYGERFRCSCGNKTPATLIAWCAKCEQEWCVRCGLREALPRISKIQDIIDPRNVRFGLKCGKDHVLWEFGRICSGEVPSCGSCRNIQVSAAVLFCKTCRKDSCANCGLEQVFETTSLTYHWKCSEGHTSEVAAVISGS